VNGTSKRSSPLVSKSESPISLAGKIRLATWWKPGLLVLTIGVILIGARLLGLGERLQDLRQWIDSLGAWGPLIFVFLYAVAVVSALPGSALTVASGALFGSILGVVVVSAGSTLGASLCFLIARYAARTAVSGWLKKSNKFRRLDQLTRKRGAMIVAITRLVPLFPFNLLNYGFGLTAVPFRTYVFWSWLCMLPGTVVYVIGGDAFAQGLGRGGVAWSLVFAIGLAAVLLVMLVRLARRKLKESGGEVEGD
jgi:uncharacterized membrane protein YdjX (TVP38/TMEM64 family)